MATSGKVQKNKGPSNVKLYHQAVGELIRLKLERNMLKSLENIKFALLTPLEWGNLLKSAVSARRYKVALWIISMKSPDVDTSDWFDELGGAIYDNNFPIVEFILANGMTINKFENEIEGSNQDGYTLRYANRSSFQLILLLIENGARPTKNGNLREWRQLLLHDTSFSPDINIRNFMYRAIRYNQTKNVDRSAYNLHNEECPITQEPLTSYTEIGICENCENGFSADALRKWLDQSRKCPLCKYQEPFLSDTINFVFSK